MSLSNKVKRHIVTIGTGSCTIFPNNYDTPSAWGRHPDQFNKLKSANLGKGSSVIWARITRIRTLGNYTIEPQGKHVSYRRCDFLKPRIEDPTIFFVVGMVLASKRQQPKRVFFRSTEKTSTSQRKTTKSPQAGAFQAATFSGLVDHWISFFRNLRGSEWLGDWSSGMILA